MRLTSALLACSLWTASLAFPSPSGLTALWKTSEVFIGPPTRAQRIAEGWVDESTKYFHEPGDDDLLHHYDIRYYKGIVTYEERTKTLHHMIRAYLEFFKEMGLETWIAHGTLLGWWWNGAILPWDWDVDTQVTDHTLAILATQFNQSIHFYSSEDGTVSRQYLLDVNPMSWERVRGDGMNIIDARWIDTTNGLFIDITGLSETDPIEQPGVWSCKNLHQYQKTDLYPMRDSVFEGVPTKIPYAYERLLVEEYQDKALILTEYEGHVWDEDKRIWVKKSSLSSQHDKEPVNSKRKRR